MFAIDKRPLVLSEIAGNEGVLKELKKRSVDINFNTYNLFYGPTGIGKSTSVFIITKLINCKSPVLNSEGYYDPCNKCVACLDIINEEYNRDVLYMDASKMGKEEVNKLSQTISRYAMYDNSKIIIIDEAHLLASKSAKSAMLLMTERKRDHSYLFMCTTEPKKIPKELFSRFQSYKFLKMDVEILTEYLIKFIIDNKLGEDMPEDSEFGPEALTAIAYSADGSYRQALVTLERCLYAETFTKEQIINDLGILSEDAMKEATHALIGGHKLFFQYFNDFRDKDQLEDFFSYALMMINKALIYKLTSNTQLEIIQEWEANCYGLSKLIEKEDNLNALHDLFLKVEEKRNGFYFSVSFFLSLIISYINKYNIPIVHKAPIVKPRRVVSE